MLRFCDARIGLAELEPGSVDLIVSDVPYRTISGGNKYPTAPKGVLTANDGMGGFKNNSIEPHEYADLMHRALRDDAHCYIMTNLKNLFNINIDFVTAGFKLHNILIWKKNTANPNRWYMQDKEYILFFRKGRAFPINDAGTKSVIEVRNIVGNRIHPAQKPLQLMWELIRNSSQPGEVVLDPFMGCGTTCLAAMLGGRRFIGFENDAEHFAVAQKRFSLL